MEIINDWNSYSFTNVTSRKCNRAYLQRKLSDCLKSKRIAMREVNPQSVRFMCKKVEAETEIYMGQKKILRIISMGTSK